MRAHSALLSAVFGSTGRACAGAAAGGRSFDSTGVVAGGLRDGGFGSAAATGRAGVVDVVGASREGNVSGAAVAVAVDAGGVTTVGATGGAVTATGAVMAALAATAEAAFGVIAGVATVGVAVVAVGAGGVAFGQSAKAARAATTTRPTPPATSGILLAEAGEGIAASSTRVGCTLVAGTACRVGSWPWVWVR